MGIFSKTPWEIMMEIEFEKRKEEEFLKKIRKIIQEELKSKVVAPPLEKKGDE